MEQSTLHLGALSQPGATLDADASWAMAVALCTPIETLFDLQLRISRLCIPHGRERRARTLLLQRARRSAAGAEASSGTAASEGIQRLFASVCSTQVAAVSRELVGIADLAARKAVQRVIARERRVQHRSIGVRMSLQSRAAPDCVPAPMEQSTLHLGFAFHTAESAELALCSCRGPGEVQRAAVSRELVGIADLAARKAVQRVIARERRVQHRSIGVRTCSDPHQWRQRQAMPDEPHCVQDCLAFVMSLKSRAAPDWVPAPIGHMQKKSTLHLGALSQPGATLDADACWAMAVALCIPIETLFDLQLRISRLCIPHGRERRARTLLLQRARRSAAALRQARAVRLWVASRGCSLQYAPVR
ncbi:unnamed protein product [Symbiodinium sp. CCMP2592]|nr:unnamed protein product [Symbiodinium sp. CCMP2592]